MKRKILTLSPSPADCKKLSIYSQHPSPRGEGTCGNPTASGWGMKNIINAKDPKKPKGSSYIYFSLAKLN
jgi:hypothetical protein